MSQFKAYFMPRLEEGSCLTSFYEPLNSRYFLFPHRYFIFVGICNPGSPIVIAMVRVPQVISYFCHPSSVG